MQDYVSFKNVFYLPIYLFIEMLLRFGFMYPYDKIFQYN